MITTWSTAQTLNAEHLIISNSSSSSSSTALYLGPQSCLYVRIMPLACSHFEIEARVYGRSHNTIQYLEEKRRNIWKYKKMREKKYGNYLDQSPSIRTALSSWSSRRRKSMELYVSFYSCLLYTSPSPRDQRGSRMPSSA